MSVEVKMFDIDSNGTLKEWFIKFVAYIKLKLFFNKIKNKKIKIE